MAAAARRIGYALDRFVRPLPPLPVSTVLIADNDAAVSALLAEVLVRRGLAVERAFDGAAAAARARAPHVAVLVCDLDMPKLGGADVLESLADLPRPPLAVVVSGYLDAAIEHRLQRLPFVVDVFRKPFDLLAFAGRVAELVATRSAGDQPPAVAEADG